MRPPTITRRKGPRSLQLLSCTAALLATAKALSTLAFGGPFAILVELDAACNRKQRNGRSTLSVDSALIRVNEAGRSTPAQRVARSTTAKGQHHFYEARIPL